MNTSHPPIKIYGSGGHSQVIRHVLEENGYTISDVYDDHPESVHRASVNVVQGLRGKDKASLKQDSPVVIAIGNNRERSEISRLLQANYQTVIHRSAIIASNSAIGDGTVIFAGAIIQPNTVIGKHVIINTGASIDHDNVIGDYAHISPKAALTGHVEIGEGTHVGVGAVIIPTVKIGKWCTIGAGAVVLKDVPDYCTVVGNPGRIIKRQLPPLTIENHSEDTPYDLAFLGTGISAAFTLLKLLENLPAGEQKLKIALIEKSGDYFTGIPYGTRSGHSTHLITDLKDFLPEAERKKFIKWLSLNKDWLLKRLKEEGGALTNTWLKDHAVAISKDEWENLYVPRSFFGTFMQETLQHLIEKAKTSGRICVDYHTREILEVQSRDYGYLLKSTQKEFKARKVILGIGSPKQRDLDIPKDIQQGQQLIVSNPYERGIDQIMKQVIKFVHKNKVKKYNVLILGSNASALEFLYKMNDLKGIDSKIANYAFLSTHGLSPDPMVKPNEEQTFIPKHTQALAALDSLTAEQIYKAVSMDLNDAEDLGMGASLTVQPISAAFTPLLAKLNQREKERFACYYGNEIGRRQRVAGLHYTRTIDELKLQGRFEHLQGSFKRLELKKDKKLSVVYSCDRPEENYIHHPIDIVINCLGSATLNEPEAPGIVKNIVKSGIANVNPSERGLSVNSQLEINKDLHLIGPLLAGNVINGDPVWHLEHCGRIIGISEILANILLERQSKPGNTSAELVVHELNNRKGLERYRAILAKYNEHPYYRFEYFKHHKKDDNKIMVAELLCDGESMGIMPFLKRKIDDVNIPGYYDVITPYGYGGPLFKPGTSMNLKQRFWELMDGWYREENVVSEFIRFNHDENHLGYQGELIPTLKNVKGRILNDKEEQWKQFKPKVRNNYRKAERHQLGFCSYSGKEINRDHIASFHSIYTETMDRNNATSNYFFRLDYFENLILSDPDSFILTFTIKDHEIASTELIIVHNDMMFAFLGGTRAKYFPCRPNDFLRVEVIELGRKKGLKWYILGGGRKDNDGLYKSKKYLFPKDEDFVFYTGRKIVNREIYNALCNGLTIPEEENFFPKYRVKTMQEATTSP